MKLNFPYLALIVIILSSCSKYENFAGYEENTDDLLANITLVSSNTQNTIEVKLFDMINNHRTNIGLNELIFESATYYYAGIHTDYMIENGNISHDKFTERAENISKRTEAIFVAENVARNYDTLEKTFEAWMDSPGHRKNIEGDYDYSAISIRPNSNGNLYFTQIFFR